MHISPNGTKISQRSLKAGEPTGHTTTTESRSQRTQASRAARQHELSAHGQSALSQATARLHAPVSPGPRGRPTATWSSSCL